MKKTKYIGLIVLVIILIVGPLMFLKDAEFEGADGQAEEIISEINPEYEPWFDAFFEPASGEIESMLFSLQAALGAGFIGYFIGMVRGKRTFKGHGI